MSTLRNMLISVVLFATLGLGHASTISVTNASFETPALSPGGYVVFDGIGTYSWKNVAGNNAIQHPTGGHDMTAAADGTNFAYIDAGNSGIISQEGVATIDESLRYTLSLMVGQLVGFQFAASYTIALTKNGATAASYTSSVSPGQDQWCPVTFTYRPSPGDAGQSLGIKISAVGAGYAYLAVDKVQLSTEVAAPLVANGSFETPALSPGGYVFLDTAGSYSWTASGNNLSVIEHAAPGYDMTAAADGANFCYIHGMSGGTTISQDGCDVIYPSMKYILSMRIGQLDLPDFSPYTIELTKNGATAASFTSSVGPGRNTWFPDPVTLTYRPSPSDVGQSLGIKIHVFPSSGGYPYIAVDNVQLSAVALPRGTKIMIQ